MATTKNATYKIYNGTDWDTYYFKTSAAQVGESNGTLNFLRPNTHKVNGKSFWSGTAHQGITLYGSDILMTADSGASTVSAAVSELSLNYRGLGQQVSGIVRDLGYVVDGTTPAGKASKDAKGNVIDTTYATNDTITALEESVEEVMNGVVTNIENGTTVAGKATNDANGKAIHTTYETKSDASSKLAEAKKYTDDELKKILGEGALDQAYDTLKEVSDYLATHDGEAAGMMQDIETLIGDVEDLSNNKQDKLTAGANIQINEDGIISATDTTYGKATASADGLMSSSDFSKLSGITSGAQANVIERVVVNNISGTVSNKTQYITIPEATTAVAGLMSAADKNKLDTLSGGMNENNSRNIYMGATTPTGMKNGDIWIQY